MWTRKSNIPKEYQEQRDLVRWIRFNPTIKDYIIKLNNEGKRTAAQTFNLKMMGLCPGASDLFLAFPAHGKHGFFIELKRNKEYTDSDRKTATWIGQLAFIEKIKKVGYHADFCYGWEDAKIKIERYLNGQYR